MALPLFGSMVFGVFGQVSVGARFLDRIDDPGPLFAQRLQLGNQAFIAFRQHRQLFDTRHYSRPPVALRISD